MDVQYNPANGGANTAAGSSPNNIKPKSNTARNRVDMNYQHLMTARYGDVTPFFVMHAVAGDRIPLQSNYELRSFTMKSPMLSNLKMHRSYYQVPLTAILPRSAEYIITNPTQGDDVPADAICYTDKVFEVGASALQCIFSNAKNASGNTTWNLETELNCYCLAESIFSSGSLPAYLGAGLEGAINELFFSNVIGVNVKDKTFHKFSDAFLTSLKDMLDGLTNEPYITVTGIDTILLTRGADGKSDIATFRRWLDLIRENPSGYSIAIIGDEDKAAVASWIDSWSNISASGQTEWSVEHLEDVVCPFNYDSLAAYQLVNAEFYSNDQVDSVYTAALYRSNIEALTDSLFNELDFYDYNGTKVQYDAFSGHYFDKYTGSFTYHIQHKEYIDFSFFAYYSLLFGWRHSLRFTDYFTSARPRPLAVGNVTAAVVNNGVSAVEMTRNIQMQRFLNSVQRTGRRFASYLEGIFGQQLPPDYHEPKFIASSMDTIGGFEVENTTDTNAGKQVSLLKSTGGKYEFEVDVDMPSVILGLVHFDVIRAYADAISKFFMHKDRFDMFNPYMQYVGDQPIKSQELTSRELEGFTWSQPNWAYQVRYCEYKQRPSIATGGFTNNILPSWAFVQDSADIRGKRAISSELIRSRNHEFDRFYSSLAGVTLEDYFHFIISMVNVCKPLRPMEVKPNIL